VKKKKRENNERTSEVGRMDWRTMMKYSPANAVIEKETTKQNSKYHSALSALNVIAPKLCKTKSLASEQGCTQLGNQFAQEVED
jgi:hypothetical protein